MQNKYAACDWLFPLSGPLAIEMAAEAGYEGIQIADQYGSRQSFALNNPRVQEAYLKAADEKNIQLLTFYYMEITHRTSFLQPLGTADSDDALFCVKRGIDACADMKIPTAYLASFFEARITNDEEMKNYAAHFAKVLEYAEDKGVCVQFESVLSADELVRFYDYVGRDFLLLHDTANPLIFGTGHPTGDLEQIISKVGIDKIGIVHTKDVDSVSPLHFCGMGEGSCMVPETAKLLVDGGWKGWVVNENFHAQSNHAPGEDLQAIFKKDLALLKELYG